MRYIKTIVMHLYVDPAVPERLCGDMRPVEAPENYPFKNHVELEELLRRLIGKPPISTINLNGCGAQPKEKGLE